LEKLSVSGDSFSKFTAPLMVNLLGQIIPIALLRRKPRKKEGSL